MSQVSDQAERLIEALSRSTHDRFNLVLGVRVVAASGLCRKILAERFEEALVSRSTQVA